GFSYVDVPATAIVCAILAIVLAFGMSERLTATRVQAGATALAVLLSIGIIFGTLYLSFTPVGYYFIDGVQGRYFLPLALLACAVILRFIPLRVVGASGQPAVRGTSIAVVVLTVLSLLTTVARYYFTVWL
ncbi:MAG: DUF2142 domain-containing protein, partial [Rhodococcus sp. (in: high G+C Gram-positive bacteria)]|uniref:DUF2142 domain-containing protein n=1 Tax=Rhodococcus sp. TaxID=1831 RepID=UPI003BB1F67E